MKHYTLLLMSTLSGLGWNFPAMAFDSGSTGADGDFAPTTDVTLGLPENGIFNFTTVNIPTGVTVRFGQNSRNTPAILLVQGDMVVDGTIDISGVDGGAFGFVPPGGYRGGFSASAGKDGINGLGPGGGRGGVELTSSSTNCGGGGAAYFTSITHKNSSCTQLVPDALSYGSPRLLPLLGGSGGGSGVNLSTDNSVFSGAGGSGGGALLLAVTGSLTLNGAINAKGGDGGPSGTSSRVTAGGGGSGGGLRIVATNFSGGGNIDLSGGVEGDSAWSASNDGSLGSPGRLRIEAESSTFNGTVLPATNSFVSTGAPSALFAANVPTIRITGVAGRNVPEVPTGDNDVFLPSTTANPVAVDILTTQVPVGEVVRLTVTPQTGAVVSADSEPLTGTVGSATATASVDLAPGASVLTASVNFTVTASAGDALANFARGERVERIELASSLSGASTTTFITVSGKSYTWQGNIAAALN